MKLVSVFSLVLSLYSSSILAHADESTNPACNATYSIKLYSKGSGTIYTGTYKLSTLEDGLTRIELDNIVPAPDFPQLKYMIGNCVANANGATFEFVRSAKHGDGPFVFQHYKGTISPLGSCPNAYKIEGTFSDDYTDGPFDGISQ